jgi:hypothetical protein
MDAELNHKVVEQLLLRVAQFHPRDYYTADPRNDGCARGRIAVPRSPRLTAVTGLDGRVGSRRRLWLFDGPTG